MAHRQALRLLALVVSLALVAVACGAGDDDEAADTDDTSAETSGDTEPAGPPEPAPGFDGETIDLGVLTPLTGLVATIGGPLTAGNQLWFDYVNSEGGIAGEYPVELTTADTEYTAEVAVQEYSRLKDDVVAFLQVLGTDVTNAVLPQMERDGKAGSPATLDVEWWFESNLMPLNGPYQIQMINGASWYVNDAEDGGADKTACALIQNDGYGEAGLEGVEVAGESLGFEVPEANIARYETGASDFTAQIQQLVDRECEVVYGVLLASSTSAALGKAVELDFAPQWILQSPAWLGLFAGTDLADYLEQNVLVLSEGPAWGDESVPGMADLLARFEEFGADEQYAGDFYFVYGYNQGRVVTEVLENAVANGDLSPDGILAAIEETGTISFDGLGGDITLGPVGERDFSRVTSVFEVARDQPFGLSLVEQDISSEAAQSYEPEVG